MIILDENDRGAGMGRSLMSTAMSEIKAKSYKSVSLEVDEENIEAFRWYARLGFVVTGRTPEDEGKSYIKMCLNLFS